MVFSVIAGSNSHNGERGLRVTGFAALTVTLVVLGLAHWPGLGVKVSVWGPGPAELGSKLFAATPVPDQLPVIPPISEGNGAVGSFSQKGGKDGSAIFDGAGPLEIVAEVVTGHILASVKVIL